MTGSSAAPKAYVSFEVTDNTGIGTPGMLPGQKVYVFMISTVGGVVVGWNIDVATGIATALAAGKMPPTVALADLPQNGKRAATIKIAATSSVVSGCLYFGTSPNVVGLNASNQLTGPTPGSADFYYDVVEFSCSGGTDSGSVNVDLTQVDQFGFPIRLHVSPPDSAHPKGSGFEPLLSRAEIFAAYSPYLKNASQLGHGFEACNIANGAAPPFCLLNPTHVLANALSSAQLQGNLATATQAPNNGPWSVNFVMSTGEPSTNWNNCYVVGSTLPFGTKVALVNAGAQPLMTLTSASTGANPFPAAGPATIYVLSPSPSPPPPKLITYFDAAIANLFLGPQDSSIVVNFGGNTYTGKPAIVQDVVAIDNKQYSYNVLQFTSPNTSDIYNVFCPFFSTNSSFCDPAYVPADVPPPPAFFSPQLNILEAPSQMVFACDGVFNDAVQRFAPGSPQQIALGALENVVAAALMRDAFAGLPNWTNLYPPNGTWSAYAGFLHNGTVNTAPIVVDGLAYGFAYDDQGGFSSDLNSTWTGTPTTVSIALNTWIPFQ